MHGPAEQILFIDKKTSSFRDIYFCQKYPDMMVHVAYPFGESKLQTSGTTDFFVIFGLVFLVLTVLTIQFNWGTLFWIHTVVRSVPNRLHPHGNPMEISKSHEIHH